MNHGTPIYDELKAAPDGFWTGPGFANHKCALPPGKGLSDGSVWACACGNEWRWRNRERFGA